jgi:hypothetical protein
MKTRIICLSMGTALAALTASCAWVELKPQAEKVRTLAPQEVGRCKPVGKVTANTLPKVLGFIARSRDTVQEEVRRLASNNAADMGADTIVPAGPLIDGEQSFNAYRCIMP